MLLLAVAAFSTIAVVTAAGGAVAVLQAADVSKSTTLCHIV